MAYHCNTVMQIENPMYLATAIQKTGYLYFLTPTIKAFPGMLEGMVEGLVVSGFSYEGFANV